MGLVRLEVLGSVFPMQRQVLTEDVAPSRPAGDS